MTFRIAFTFVGVALQLAGRDRAWQTGTLLDETKTSTYLGTLSLSSASAQASAARYGNTVAGQASGTSVNSSVARYRTDETLIVDSTRYTFLLGRRVWVRQAALTVNGPIKFAVEGADVYVLDEMGKEFQTNLIRKVLKATSQTLNWKSVSGLDHYSVRFSDDFVYAENVADDRNWTKFEARRTGEEYIGNMHRSIEGCVFDSEVDFLIVNYERLEGYFVTAPASAKFDRKTCAYSKPNRVFSFTWVPE
jgi:hypothetical protein